METRSQSAPGTPAAFVVDMVSRWRPRQAPVEEAVHLAREALRHSGLGFERVEDLCGEARPNDSALWREVFGHHRQQITTDRAQLPTPRLEGPDLNRSCHRIASAVRIRELRAAHDANRDLFRRLFGVENFQKEQRHLVNLTSVLDGQHLAEYLDIPREQVLTLKTGKSVRRPAEQGGSLSESSSLWRGMRKKVAAYPGLETMPSGSVTVLGHFHWDKQDRPLCGFLRAEDLVKLFGDAFRPRALNLFFCGSEPFAYDLEKLLEGQQVVVNYVLQDVEINLHVCAAERFRGSVEARERTVTDAADAAAFYYAGPNVAVDGAIGKVFGPRQSDAFRFFRTLEAGGGVGSDRSLA